ncbi:MAG: hypothetical protein R2825_00745 [Saprospiraceae bacterium]
MTILKIRISRKVLKDVAAFQRERGRGHGTIPRRATSGHGLLRRNRTIDELQKAKFVEILVPGIR